jgi:predicted transcriptional regulator
MAKSPDLDLSRRERQIMNVLFRRGEAAVTDIAGEIPDAPSDTAIRTFLKILERKGHVRRHKDGRRHLYRPAKSRRRAARAALVSVLGTFFDGSLGDAVAAHLSNPSSKLDAEELERLQELIDQAKEGSP